MGPEPLAGVAVEGSYYQMFWLFGLGSVLMSISPIVAHAYGAGRDDEEVGRRFPPGLCGSRLMLAVPLVSALACVKPLLGLVRHGRAWQAIPHAAGYTSTR